jgi:hypothetical protein
LDNPVAAAQRELENAGVEMNVNRGKEVVDGIVHGLNKPVGAVRKALFLMESAPAQSYLVYLSAALKSFVVQLLIYVSWWSSPLLWVP